MRRRCGSDSTHEGVNCRSRRLAIPAHPLALDAERALDERRQRALRRYYVAAGAGGLAVGVHTTQFAIRDRAVGLFEPVLDARARRRWTAPTASGTQPLVRIAGVVRPRRTQAVARGGARSRRSATTPACSACGADGRGDDELIAHCRAVADVIPLVGFYLQPAVGGRLLPYSFWRRFAEIDERRRDQDRAVQPLPDDRRRPRRRRGGPRRHRPLHRQRRQHRRRPASRRSASTSGRHVERRIVGGLLGHWAVWTQARRRAAGRVPGRASRRRPGPGATLLRAGVEVTDANAAFFDAANGFAGCIAGLHEVLRRQGLLEGTLVPRPARDARPRPGARRSTASTAPTRT